MADALVKAGKHFDMFVVPGAGHDLGYWQYHHEIMWKYFAEHLIEGRMHAIDSGGSLR
jgi:hypothetical protein